MSVATIAGKGTMRPAVVEVKNDRIIAPAAYFIHARHTPMASKKVDIFLLLSPLSGGERKHDLVEYGHHMKYPPGASTDRKVYTAVSPYTQ